MTALGGHSIHGWIPAQAALKRWRKSRTTTGRNRGRGRDKMGMIGKKGKEEKELRWEHEQKKSQQQGKSDEKENQNQKSGTRNKKMKSDRIPISKFDVHCLTIRSKALFLLRLSPSSINNESDFYAQKSKLLLQDLIGPHSDNENFKMKKNQSYEYHTMKNRIEKTDINGNTILEVENNTVEGSEQERWIRVIEFLKVHSQVKKEDSLEEDSLNDNYEMKESEDRNRGSVRGRDRKGGLLDLYRAGKVADHGDEEEERGSDSVGLGNRQTGGAVSRGNVECSVNETGVESDSTYNRRTDRGKRRHERGGLDGVDNDLGNDNNDRGRDGGKVNGNYQTEEEVEDGEEEEEEEEIENHWTEDPITESEQTLIASLQACTVFCTDENINVSPSSLNTILQRREKRAALRLYGLQALTTVMEMKLVAGDPYSLQEVLLYVRSSLTSNNFLVDREQKSCRFHYLVNLEGCSADVLGNVQGTFLGLYSSLADTLSDYVDSWELSSFHALTDYFNSKISMVSPSAWLSVSRAADDVSEYISISNRNNNNDIDDVNGNCSNDNNNNVNNDSNNENNQNNDNNNNNNHISNQSNHNDHNNDRDIVDNNFNNNHENVIRNNINHYYDHYDYFYY